MRTLIDLTGQRFGRLVVLERAESAPNHKTQWLCQCDCGSQVIVRSDSLTSGRTLSCGCLQRERSTIHGETGDPLYYTWQSMRYRCNNPNNKNYENYGGRGIIVCDDWNNDYISFRDWALNNGYEQGLSIDRMDNDGIYEPDNCRWATAKQQQNNRRCNVIYSMNGEAHTLSEWCDIVNLPYKTVIARINDRGWSFEQAITTPIRTYSKG